MRKLQASELEVAQLSQNIFVRSNEMSRKRFLKNRTEGRFVSNFLQMDHSKISGKNIKVNQRIKSHMEHKA